MSKLVMESANQPVLSETTEELVFESSLSFFDVITEIALEQKRLRDSKRLIEVQ